jgi:hypothetical protein
MRKGNDTEPDPNHTYDLRIRIRPKNINIRFRIQMPNTRPPHGLCLLVMIQWHGLVLVRYIRSDPYESAFILVTLVRILKTFILGTKKEIKLRVQFSKARLSLRILTKYWTSCIHFFVSYKTGSNMGQFRSSGSLIQIMDHITKS